MYRKDLWYASDEAILEFGKDEDNALDGRPILLGELQNVRAEAQIQGKNFLYRVSYHLGSAFEMKDPGDNADDVISGLSLNDYGSAVYLDRYRGIDPERRLSVQAGNPGLDLMEISDDEFQALFPEADMSCVALNPRFAMINQRYALDGHDMIFSPVSAAELPFEKWAHRGFLPGEPLQNNVMPMERKPGHKETTTHKDILYQLSRRYRAGDQFETLRETDDTLFLRAGSNIFAVAVENGTSIGILGLGEAIIVNENEAGTAQRDFHVLIDELELPRLQRAGRVGMTDGGLRARREAHEEICIRALERGDPVSEENLKTYSLKSPDEDLDTLSI